MGRVRLTRPFGNAVRNGTHGESLITGFSVAVALCALAAAVASFVLAARGHPPLRMLLLGVAAVEVLLVAHLVIAVVLLFVSGTPDELATFIAYLVASVLALPIGTAWALAEYSRSSTAVLGVVCVAAPVIVLRMGELWGTVNA